MYKELYQYFILNRELQLPGIGTFLLERQPAEIDFPNRAIQAPTYAIVLQVGNMTSSRSLYRWLASAYQTGEAEAVVRFNDFVFQLKNKILAGNKLVWSGFGTLSKGYAGEIRFEPSPVPNYSGSLPATKVLRENAEHTVRVGEQEMSSGEVVSVFQSETITRNKSWILIVLLIIAAVSFIGYYFSEHGVETTSSGSRTIIRPSAPVPNSTNIP
ncbi:MAG: hypothetical protein ABWZ25_00260 [Chitinophagaceae bacterium]